MKLLAILKCLYAKIREIIVCETIYSLLKELGTPTFNIFPSFIHHYSTNLQSIINMHWKKKFTQKILVNFTNNYKETKSDSLNCYPILK